MTYTNDAALLSPAVEPEKPGEPWERQEDEPARAYAGFCAYRGLGPSRSLDLAYTMVAKPEKDGTQQKAAKRAPATFRDLSNRWNWQIRAYEWDMHEDARRLKEREDAGLKLLEEHKERSRRLAIVQQNLVTRGLVKIGVALDAMDAKPERLGPNGEIIPAQAEKIIEPADIPRWMRALALLSQSGINAESQTLAVDYILSSLSEGGAA